GYRLPEGPVAQRFDPEQLRKALGNVIANAVKFTPPGGKVHVSLEVEGPPGSGRVVLGVQDTGPGIPTACLPHLFELFYQADDGAAEGSGIGLALAKELVELHGGRIEVESEGGFGSTCRLVLPHRPPAPDDGPLREDFFVEVPDGAAAEA